ncbi:hypothetical protein [Lapidilactobacillus gannanensis]|uniref:Uncharacterized protein n=1 Tax=Lapidilactobacillus gannanensis TaxID=2486002 RepID=A0ABW4BNL0_9LACO|nr:hypothetical protein [Lapidilactobacillus gannanensis]
MKLLSKSLKNIFWTMALYVILMSSLISITRVRLSIWFIMLTIIGALITAGLTFKMIDYLRKRLTPNDFKRFRRHRRQDCKILYTGILLFTPMLLWSKLIPGTASIYFIYLAGFFLLVWFVIDLDQQLFDQKSSLNKRGVS